MYVSFNNEIIPENEVRVGLDCQALFFGDGFFTTTKVENGKILSYKLHLKRIEDQCLALNILKPDLDIEPLIKKNRAEQGSWKLKILVTSTIPFQATARPPLTLLLLTPYKDSKQPVRLKLITTPSYSAYASLKTLAYLPNLMQKQEAIQEGFDDSLLKSPENFILETSNANIFWIDNKVLYTPCPTLPLLFGTTIQQIVKPSTLYRKLPLEKIPTTARVYICNSLKGIQQVQRINTYFYPLQKTEFENLEDNLAQSMKEVKAKN